MSSFVNLLFDDINPPIEELNSKELFDNFGVSFENLISIDILYCLSIEYCDVVFIYVFIYFCVLVQSRKMVDAILFYYNFSAGKQASCEKCRRPDTHIGFLYLKRGIYAKNCNS